MFCGTCGSTDSETISLHYIFSAEPCRGLDEGLCDTCQQLEVLASQISQTAETLRRLVSRHQKLRAKRNHIHSPILNRVPSEIISSIFHHFISGVYVSTEWNSADQDCQIESNGDAHTPFILGAVCRTWRNIALATPQLWRSISISLGPDNFPARVKIAQQWLLRSGDLPLSIHIHSAIDRNEDVNRSGSEIITRCRPLIEIVNHYSKRWDHLHLNIPHFMFSYFCGDAHGAPILRKLCVEPDSYNYSTECQFRLQGERPRPQQIFIKDQRFKVVDIAWDNVTWVEAIGFHVPDCLELLRQAPQLLYCKLLNVSMSRAEFPMPSSPLTHKLHRLDFQTRDYLAGVFFAYVTLPSLTHLNCHLEEAATEYAGLPSFFSRSSCPLRELSIIDAEFDDNDLIQILNTSPSITHLVLAPLSYYESFTPTFLFEFLARTSILPYDDNADLANLLPKLEHLEFHAWQDCRWNHLTDIFGPLDNIQNIRRRPLKSLKFTFVRDPMDVEERRQAGESGYIDREVLHRILELKKAGIQIEVFDNTQRLDVIETSVEFYGIRK
ncbi:hypothetical protein GALMADRAFT_235339 [Galerina marginata CBS 339.88]|uniref:Uncharacterized protein n=1 Tax=Galerina marginata (strain CBS 339.88) TaxID=685588 RepID=A0A067U1E7_GALM3|nr:hypothetical protein GALMADRAFT_235339 [Galerina marginata CBS 339.88]